MAAKELYDYLSIVTPDKDERLFIHPIIPPVVNIPETVTKKDIIRIMDDGSEERIAATTKIIAYIDISWNSLRATDAGTLLDFYCDPTKANGKVNSFKYVHYDTHTYVVRFDSDFKRDRIFAGDTYRIQPIKLRVLGLAAVIDMSWEDSIDIDWEDGNTMAWET